MRPHYDNVPSVLLIGPRHDRAVLATAATAGGMRIAGEADWVDLAAVADAPASLALAAAGDVAPDDLPDLLAPLASVAEAFRDGAIVTLREKQIDPVAAFLLGSSIELLCDPDAAALTGAVAFALARHGDRLADTVREGESERLRRLNEEVARIAAVLTRLTREGDRRPVTGVADRNMNYAAPPGRPNVAAEDIRRAIRARRLRDTQFADGMFEDPAWDMLLDLYAAGLEGTQVSVSSLCIAAAVPPTTALRWIARMSEAGLFDRAPDPFDRRRAFMGLSELGRDKMDRYFALLAQNGLSIA